MRKKWYTLVPLMTYKYKNVVIIKICFPSQNFSSMWVWWNPLKRHSCLERITLRYSYLAKLESTIIFVEVSIPDRWNSKCYERDILHTTTMLYWPWDDKCMFRDKRYQMTDIFPSKSQSSTHIYLGEFDETVTCVWK